jgi:hypothetical protein
MKKTIQRILTMLCAAALICLTLAGCAPAAGTGAEGATTGGGYTSIIMIVVLVAVFYLSS